MADMHDEYVSVEHLLLAMVDNRDNSTVGRLLRRLARAKMRCSRRWRLSAGASA
jgi:hypothetical protein